MKSNRKALGIDIGGTKSIAALIDERGTVLNSRRIENPENCEPGKLISKLASQIHLILDESGLDIHELTGMGIGAVGQTDVKKGIIFNSSLSDWLNVPVVDMFCSEIGVKAVLENDVNAGVYGEYLFGAGKGSKNLVAVFIGTGIGGGFIINRQLYSGAAGFAADIGHMIYRPGGEPCRCGKAGHFEAYAGGACIRKRFQRAIISGRTSTVLEKAKGKLERVRASDIFMAAAEGDELCTELWKDAEDALKVLICNLATALDPDVIVLGGGIIENITGLTESIEQYVLHHTLNNVASHIRIVKAELSKHAVVIGAAALGGYFSPDW